MYEYVPSFRWKLKIGGKDVTNRLLRMRVIQKMPQDLLFTVSMPLYQIHIDLVDVKLGDMSKGLKVHILEDTNLPGDRFLLPPFYVDSISFFEGKLRVVCLPFFVLRSFSKSIDKGNFYVQPDIFPAVLGSDQIKFKCLPTLDGYFSAVASPRLGQIFAPFVTLYTPFDAVPPSTSVGFSHVFTLSNLSSPVCLFDSDSVYSVEDVEPLPSVSTVLKPEIKFLPAPAPLFEFTGLRGPFSHLWYILFLGEEFLFLSRLSNSIFRAEFLASRQVCVFSVPEDAEFSAFLGSSYVLFSTPNRGIVIDCYSGEKVYEYAGSVLLSYAPSEVYFSDYLDSNRSMVFALLSLSKGPSITALFVTYSKEAKPKFYTATLDPIHSDLAFTFNKGVICFKGSYVALYIDIEVYFVEDKGRFYVLCVNYPYNKYACVPLDFSSRPLNVSLGIKGAFCMDNYSLGLVIHSDGYRYEVRNILRFNSSFNNMYKGNPKITFEKGSAFYEPVISPKTLPGVDTYMSKEEYSSPARFFFNNTFDTLKKGFVKDKRYYVANGSFYVSSRVKYRSNLIVKFSFDSSQIKVFRPSTAKEDSVSWNYVSSVRLFDAGLNVSVPTMYSLPVSVLPVFSSWRVKDIVAGRFLRKKDNASDWKVYNISPNRILPLGSPVKFIDTDGIEKEGRVVSSEYIYEGTEKIKIRVLC